MADAGASPGVVPSPSPRRGAWCSSSFASSLGGLGFGALVVLALFAIDPRDHRTTTAVASERVGREVLRAREPEAPRAVSPPADPLERWEPEARARARLDDWNAGACDASALEAFHARPGGAGFRRPLVEPSCDASDARLPPGLHLGAPDAGATAFAKLERGERVVVAALGSSITSQHGGCTRPIPSVARACDDCCGSKVTSARAAPNRGWLRKVVERLPLIVPRSDAPAPDDAPPSTLLNVGLAGTSAVILAGSHFHDVVTPDMLATVDVWVVELGVSLDRLPNATGEEWRVVSDVARRLASAPNAPLVLPVTFHEWCGWCEEKTPMNAREPWTCERSPDVPRPRCPAWRTDGRGTGAPPTKEEPFRREPSLRDDAMRRLADAVGMPHYSLFSALIDGVVEEGGVRVADLTDDGTHPNECGEELVARGVLSAVDEIRRAWVCAGRPPPRSRGDGDDGDARRDDGDVRVSWKFSREAEDLPAGASSRDAAWPPVSSSSGFRYASRAENGGTREGKPGFVARRAGDYVELSLPLAPSPDWKAGDGDEGDAMRATTIATRASGRRVRYGYPRAVIEAHFLRSYEGMGAVRVTCAGGCACDAFDLDAHWSERRSTVESASWTVTMDASGAPREAAKASKDDETRTCLVRMTVSDEDRPSGAGRKFKLVAFAVEYAYAAAHLSGSARVERGAGGDEKRRASVDG